jgi:hypothetical protein
MRYRQNQGSKARRVKARHIELLHQALGHFQLKHAGTNPGLRNRARLVAAALPASAPYELRLFAEEWQIVSQALRPVGSTPRPGGLAAKYYALYTLLRKTFVFATMGDDVRAKALSQRRAPQ